MLVSAHPSRQQPSNKSAALRRDWRVFKNEQPNWDRWFLIIAFLELQLQWMIWIKS